LSVDEYLDRVLGLPESVTFDCKRILGKPDRLLETVSAFANTQGGLLALGIEDSDKANGHDRLFGLQENPENWDEFRRKLRARITDPDVLPVTVRELPCKLRDGSDGTVGFVRIERSLKVHSVVDGGTFTRLEKGNRQLSAHEINELSFARGTVSAESKTVEVDFDLLETEYWRSYAATRGLTRPIADALYHVGLAKKAADGRLRPTLAAVLLFAEQPSGLSGGKAAIRVFHFRGREVSADANTNLIRPPVTVGGPLLRQIREAAALIVREIGERVQHGPLGFEIVQKYPVRVLNEAITNAVIHRDYHLPVDIMIRLFSDRVEVESPGRLPGRVTAANIHRAGSFSRNPLIVQHLREFPSPPNLDAGEGVPMMFKTMKAAGLYPPLYRSRAVLERDAVLVTLFNQNRPTVWTQVCDHLDRHGTIGNAELRRLMETSDTLGASKQLKAWVEQGLLVVANPDAGRNVRRYARPAAEPVPDFFSSPEGKAVDGSP
jgi:ATP-dependent DNA helicase RecG